MLLTAQDVTAQVSGFSLISMTNSSHMSWKLIDGLIDGLMENKKVSDEDRRFYWIKLIDSYWLVNIDWLTDIDWIDNLSCSS